MKYRLQSQQSHKLWFHYKNTNLFSIDKTDRLQQGQQLRRNL